MRGMFFNDEKIEEHIIQEGKAKIVIPKYEKLTKDVPVFYNPEKKFDRDLSVNILNVYLEFILKRNEAKVCDLLSGSGIRGIRYYLETKKQKSKIFFVDKNKIAASYIKKNVELNKLPRDSFEIFNMDANEFLVNSREKFDIIDIDPFGDPLPFLQNSILKVKHNGLLMITATDTAPLAGRYPRVSFMKYGGVAQFVEFYPEVAIRLLLKRVLEIGAMFEVYLDPLFSYWGKNYVRLFLRVRKSKKLARRIMEEIGFIYYCEKCKYRFTTSYIIHKSLCDYCKSTNLKTIGALYLKKLADLSFLDVLLNQVKNQRDKEMENFLIRYKKEMEINTPFFYRTDTLASFTKKAEKKIDYIINQLKNLGFKAARVHSLKKGFKTDADYGTILSIFQKG